MNFLLTRAARMFGLADRQQPASAPVARPAPDLTEYGATGTPIFGGFLRDVGEYNPALEGLSAFSTYEKMRRSDAQVAATLAAMKLPIRSAEWIIQEPADATPVEREATEFVRDCLFEEIEMDSVIENALLMLDFGCSAHEDVYYIDGNRIRLKKLAARLPVTFNRWITGEGEELLAIEQYGWAGNTYKTVEVPASKLAVFTFQQEGSNFAGRSVLRPMYQHWYIKSNLYKIDAIANERNGMGVPWAKMSDNAKAEDRRTAIGWLQQLTAHEKASLLLPPGWDWGLKGVEGTLRDPKESIAHHNVMISMAGLAQFMMLGQSESGNRALGQTMSDFFYLSLEATARKIARVMAWTTIPRLVDLNFAGVKRYPVLQPQQILSVRFESVVDALQKLANGAVNAIQPDDELEEWLRRKVGAPERGKPRPRRQSITPAKDAGQEAVVSASEVAASLAKKQTGEAGAASPAVRTSREPKPYERCLALADIVSALDRGRDAVAGTIRRARPALQAEIVNKLVNAPIRQMHRVSIGPDEKLIGQVESALRGVYDFGYDQVEKERERQAAGGMPGDAAEIRMADMRKLRKKREPLGVYADAVVSEVLNILTQRAANVALDWLRRPGDLSKGEIIRRIEADLDEQSDKWIDGAASKGANEAFADGRAAGYEAYQDEITEVYYSALLDVNCCGNCAAADGASGATPDDIPGVPNPDCDGGDRCRCVHVFVFSDEVRK